MDIVSKKKRSEMMQAIKGSNTRPEIIARKHLFSLGFRYRIHNKSLPGRPDICLKKYNAVIFINGCFWHGHSNCNIFSMPKSNTKFWKDKLESNKKRDKRNIRKLKKMGWKVLVVWECQLEKRKRELTLDKLANKILGN